MLDYWNLNTRLLVKISFKKCKISTYSFTQGTPDYKDSLLHELEELVHAAEKEKEKYQTLSEKLKNNQHPERYRVWYLCVAFMKS